MAASLSSLYSWIRIFSYASCVLLSNSSNVMEQPSDISRAIDLAMPTTMQSTGGPLSASMNSLTPRSTSARLRTPSLLVSMASNRARVSVPPVLMASLM